VRRKAHPSSRRKPEAKVLREINRGQDRLLQKFLKQPKAFLHMPVARPGVIPHIFVEIVQEIRLEFVKKNVGASNGLSFDDQLRLLFFKHRQRLLVVILLRLIFRPRTSEDARRSSPPRPLSPFQRIEDFLAVPRRPLCYIDGHKKYNFCVPDCVPSVSQKERK